jgi:SHS2 domain-containing protein
MSFEEIDHTADRAFRVQGRNFAELLENAAQADLWLYVSWSGPSDEPRKSEKNCPWS